MTCRDDFGTTDPDKSESKIYLVVPNCFLGNIYLDLLIKLQKKIIRVITFSQYLAHTNDLFVQLQILPFKKLVIHRIGLQMFKNNLGYIPKAVKSLFTTNSDIHKYV